MRLIAVSPVGKNGQTVVPAAIRRMFKIEAGHNLMGFYLDKTHVEIAPVDVRKAEVEYSEAELNKLDRLAKQRGGRKFQTPDEAKKFLKGL